MKIVRYTQNNKFIPKLVAIVLICTMVLGNLVLAEETSSLTDIEICELLNVLQGEDYGLTQAYLNKDTTRFQAALMSLRLRGLEAEALAFDGKANFKDANDLTWEQGRNVLSYLYSNPELGWVGYFDGSFKPNAPITSQAYYKVMLETLGYRENDEFTWNEVFAYAKQLGMSKLLETNELKNYDIATATVEALQVINTEGEKLIDYLVRIELIPLQDAFATGLLEMDVDKGFLKIYSDDVNHTIIADGKDVTKLTVQLERLDGTLIEVDGVLDVSASIGGISNETLVFENGQASFQLTSTVEDSVVQSYVVALLREVPNAQSYEGLQASKIIQFDPEEVEDVDNGLVEVISAETQMADRFKLTFSRDITVEEYIVALTHEHHLFNWEEILVVGTNAGLMIDGQPVSIIAINQVDDNVLEFVLNTDHEDKLAPVYGKDINRISKGWSGSKLHYLEENAEHVITIPENVSDLLLANLSGISFELRDPVGIFVKNIDSDERYITIEFSEPIAEQTAEPVTRGIEFLDASTEFYKNIKGHYGNIKIDGKEVYVTFSPNDASTAERAFAYDNNLILVNNIEVGQYLDETNGREILTVELDKSNFLDEGSHSLFLQRFSDWAGVIDKSNIMNDYVSSFNVFVDSEIPTVIVTPQSPEQWLIEFNEKVVLTKDRDEAIVITYGKDDIVLNPDINGSYTYTEDDYVISDITEEINSVGTTMIIEFYKDWTEYFDTSTSRKSYWSSEVLPFEVKFVKEAIKDSDGNFMDDYTAEVVIELDSFSPMLTQAVDASTELEGVLPGEEFIIRMSEPVQIKDNSGSPSSVRMTPSEQQTMIGNGIQYDESNVPRPTFMFISGDTTVNGTIKLASISTDDMTFTVVPDRVLTHGTWTLYMSGITDDSGNAYNTQAVNVVVPSDIYGINTPMISWVGFDNTNKNAPAKQYDYIYVKFSTEMESIGASAVSRIDNYYLNGLALPEGSSVFAGIPNVTNDWDGVTLRIPADFYMDTEIGGETSATFNLRLAANMKSKAGEELIGELNVLVGDYDGLSVTEKDMLFEAMYLNYNSSVLLNGEIIINAYGTDGAKDGNIDTIYIELARTTAMNGSEKLLIGGRIYKIITLANSTSHIFVAENPNDYIIGTETSSVDIKSLQGASVLGKGKIGDNAGPAIKNILYDGNQKLTIYFSEAVKDSSVTVGDFVIGGTGIGAETITAVSTGTLVNDKIIELTLSGDPGLVVTETITIALNLSAVEDLSQGNLSTQTAPVTYIE